MNPQPKPQKKEKPIPAKTFREKYAGKKIRTVKTKGQKIKKKLSKHSMFYKSTAWKWFSRYIKLRDCDDQGVIRCATSGVLMHVSDRNLHSGHCIKVFDSNNSHYSVAFDERNVMAQSSRENRFFGGRAEVMRDKIDLKFGKGTYDELVIKSKQFKKYSESELKEISEEYRHKVNQLLKSKGIKKWWNQKNFVIVG